MLIVASTCEVGKKRFLGLRTFMRYLRPRRLVASSEPKTIYVAWRPYIVSPAYTHPNSPLSAAGRTSTRANASADE